MTYEGGTNRRHFLQRAALAAGVAVSLSGSLRAVTAALAPLSSSTLTIAEMSRRIRARDITSTDLVQNLLQRIDTLNPKLNAYITVMRERALSDAAAMDAEAARGNYRGPLHGVPIAVKDNIDTAGTRTTIASAIFDDNVPSTDAFVVQQLRRAGAILIGKTNLHEFAMGGSSATTYFGPVRNPWALERVPGGSSGGSAAAVSAQLACGALGTDTGGSIRIPASYCGVVGFKPTYGLVSLRGIFPLIYSLDHCGPITRTVEDAALLLNSMAGYDKLDIASVKHPAEDYVTGMLRHSVSSMRLGVPREPFFDHLDPGTAAAVEAALQVLSGLVKSMRDVQLPSVSHMAWTAVRAGEVAAVHEDLYRRHAENYSLQTRRVVEGTFKELNDPAQSSSSRVADFVRANWELGHLRRTIDDAFTDFDLVALPTMRVGPRTINEELRREETPTATEPENTSNSLAFNLYGIPALTLPCGFDASGMPVGLMIAGPRFSEAKILALANAFEKATPWHNRLPSLTQDTPLPALHRLN